MSESRPLLELKNLEKHFPITHGLFNKVVGHIRAERSGHAHNLRIAEHVHAQIQPTS